MERRAMEPLTPEQMTRLAEEAGTTKINKKPATTFLLAMTAGAFIAIAFVFYTTAMTGTADMAWGISHLIGGIAFSLGLILVVVCGGDLFTSTVLTTLAKMNKRVSWFQMFRNWGIVYAGNMVGASIFVLLIWNAGVYLNAGGNWGHTVLNIAQHKIHHSFTEAVTLGILCNIMVCLAVWMTYACRTVADKFLVLVLPVAMFVATGFEHSVANMFMIPLGIVVKSSASVEFWNIIGVSREAFADLTVSNYLLKNLIPVTLGNIIGGGVFVALTYGKIYPKKK